MLAAPACASGSPSASVSFDYAAGSVQPSLAPQATLADGTTVQDLRFPSPRGGTASGWLVTPAGDGPFAGLVYLHGSETDRDDFLDEAMAMATVGVASITLDAPFVRAGASRTTEAGNYFAPDKEVAMMEQSVVDLRVAVDILVASAHVDVTAGRLRRPLVGRFAANRQARRRCTIPCASISVSS